MFLARSEFDEIVGYVVVALGVCCVVYKAVTAIWPTPTVKVLRGQALITYDAARRAAFDLLGLNDVGIWIAGLRLPSAEAVFHWLITASSGGGKTIIIRMVAQDQFPLIVPGSDRRAIIYDSKGDMLQILGSIELRCEVLVLNPFDERCVAWDVAGDIDTAAGAQQLAAALMPDHDETQKFFIEAARQLVGSVVVCLILLRPGLWTLRDVLRIAESPTRMRALFSTRPEAAGVVEKYLNAGETTLGSIIATIAARLGPYEPVAASWERAKRKISIKDWVRSESILVLGNDESIRSVLDRINQLFIARVNTEILSMPDSTSRRTWMVLDEVREAGKLDINSAMLRGRSKGLAIVLGFQDLEGLQHVYGEKVANEIIGQCGNKAFLRTESPKSAKWAESMMGYVELLEQVKSTTNSSQGTSETVSEQKVVRPVVMASEFMNLPPTNERNGLHGFYSLRSIGRFKHHYTPQELKQYLLPLNTEVPASLPVPAAWQFMSPWSEDDDKRLGLRQGDGGLDGFGRIQQEA